MVKNWILLGDEAFDSDVMGFAYLKDDEMPNWQEVVLEKIRSAKKSQKLLEHVKENPYISVGALFYKGWKITDEIFNQFVEDVCVEFGDVKPVLCNLDQSNKRSPNVIIINFYRGSIFEELSKDGTKSNKKKKNLYRWIKVHVYDYELEVSVLKGSEQKFQDAADLAGWRLHRYYERYKDSKTDHEITMITILDLLCLPYRTYSDNCEKIKIAIRLCGEEYILTINKCELCLYNYAAEVVNWKWDKYMQQYGKRKTEEEISRMLLLDAASQKLEWELDYVRTIEDE